MSENMVSRRALKTLDLISAELSQYETYWCNTVPSGGGGGGGGNLQSRPDIHCPKLQRKCRNTWLWVKTRKI